MVIGDACAICEAEENLEDHHKIPQRMDGSDHAHNLVTLCRSCHMAVEKIYDNDFFRSARNHFRAEWRSSREGYDLQDHALSRLAGLPAQMFLVCLIEKGQPVTQKEAYHFAVSELGLAFSSRFDRSSFTDIGELINEGIVEIVPESTDPEKFELSIPREEAMEHLVEGLHKFLSQKTRAELNPWTRSDGTLTEYSNVSNRTQIYSADTMDWRRDEPTPYADVEDPKAVEAVFSTGGEPVADPSSKESE